MTKVSAIVSTYNAERDIRGRIEDLLQQTLYAHGELEIVVVNAGSRDGTDYILRDYLGCIVYVRSLREGIYTSWNRGIAIATGTYVTNANADDRLRPDALEVMATAFDDTPDIGFVFGDAIVTSTPNARWNGPYVVSDKPPYHGTIGWSDTRDPRLFLQSYVGGPNPMWRRTLHAQYGMFDDSFQLAGDYEWALRLIAHGVTYRHIPTALTLFYDDGANINNPEQAGMEARRALLRWGRRING